MHVFQLEKATEEYKIYQQYYVFARSTAELLTAFSKDSGMEKHHNNRQSHRDVMKANQHKW